MEEKRLQISDISCQRCVERIEKIVKSFPGIKEVNVDLAKKEVSLSFDPVLTNLPDIIKSLGDAGYHADELR